MAEPHQLDAAHGPTRRGLLRCMMWGGAGVLWTVAGGAPRAHQLGGKAMAATPSSGAFSFAQISDSHIGFKFAPNPEPAATLKAALARVVAGPRPAFMIHTGDVSHLSKAEEFDQAAELIKALKLDTFYVPGEHDVIGDDGRSFFARFGRASGTGGWYSFDYGGVHFVGLVNVVGLKPGGLGLLGATQRKWLEKDLMGQSASTPIVVFTHIPLWSLYPQWGWGTEDGEAALLYLKRFGSVTVLNGHIHQVIQKVEGNITLRTAFSTAYPQPAPGQGKGPGPLDVPAERLKSMLGVRRVSFAAGKGAALTDVTLAG